MFRSGVPLTLTELVTKSYLLATGKPTPPTIGSKRYNQILGIANIFQESWQTEPNIQWDSQWLESSAGTVTATATFTLPATVREVSEREGDYVYITALSGGVYYYPIISPNQLQAYRLSGDLSVAINGRSIRFPVEFRTTDPMFGGTITVPGFKDVTPLVLGTDIISVDDPNWLVYMCAGEYVRNDRNRVGQYGNLIDLAIDSMNKMKTTNGGMRDEIDRSTWRPLGESWT